MSALRRLRNFWIPWVAIIVLGCFSDAFAQTSYKITDLGVNKSTDNYSMAMGLNKMCIRDSILGVIFYGVSASNIWAITQTLAGPKAAGRWTGFQNFIGNLAGVVAPALTGFVLERTGQFYWAFEITTGVALVGMASWVFLIGPVEPVIWDRKLRAAAVPPSP